MRLFDQCVRCGDIAKAASAALRLGWDGICVLVPPERFSGARAAAGKSAVDVSIGVEIEAVKPADVQRAVAAFRRKAEILAFRSGTAETNRVVLETVEADLLLGAWEGGINHVLAAAAKENGVAVCFEFQPLMFSHGRQRTELFSRMLEAAKYLRKARAPIAIGSGGQDPMDIRDPSVLASLGRLLGFQDDAIKKAMSDERVLENRKRLGGKWVMPGVEVE
jgi:ribonuclease P/MRP protein subunit RPP1